MALFDRFKKTDESEMSFIDHLEVLRGTIVRSLSSVLITSLVIFIYRDWVMDNVITGPLNSDFITYKVFCDLSHWLHLGDALCMPPVKVSLQSTTFGGQFLSSISMAFVGGLIIAFPFIFYQIWSFVKPALKEKEVRASLREEYVKGAISYEEFANQTKQLNTAMLAPFDLNMEVFLRYCQVSETTQKEFIERLIKHLDSKEVKV
jgi:uncharacterized membrane protein